MKYKVDHPRLFLSVEGKMQRVPKGCAVELTEDQAKRLGGKVVAASSSETKIFVVNPEKAPEEDKSRKVELKDLIEEATGKRPGNRATLESLEKQLAELVG